MTLEREKSTQNGQQASIGTEVAQNSEIWKETREDCMHEIENGWKRISHPS